jgi:trehalose 6-phosphate phosphatase
MARRMGWTRLALSCTSVRLILCAICCALAAQTWPRLGVLVEDKGQSIALHYRLAHARSRALALIQELLAQPGLSLHSFAGKMVVNVTGRAAPDKAHAVRTLVSRCGASCALFAGDDVNDEPVFVAAPSDWLTVRVGRDEPASRAQYFLDSPVEMALLLERMLMFLTRTDPI